MRALLRVELTRLLWRRAVILLAAAAVVVPVIIFGATAWNTRPVSDADLRNAQEMVERERNQPYVEQELERCVAKPARYGLSGSTDEISAACEEQILPRAEWFLYRQPLDLQNEREEGSGIAVAIVLTMLVMLLGTTFVGHDWNSGSMSNQLLFEPRRLRVWAAKGAIVFLAGLVLAGAVLTAYWTGLWLVAEQRDITLGSGDVSGGYEQAVRGALLAASAGLGGYALTMLFRSTVATLGVLFAVSIAAPLLLTVLSFEGNQRLMPQHNVAAVLLNGTTVHDYNRGECFSEDGEPLDACALRITTGDASQYFGGMLFLAAVPSLLLFRRRDVP